MLYDLVCNQRFVVQFKKLLQMHIGCMAPYPNLGSHLLYHGTTWHFSGTLTCKQKQTFKESKKKEKKKGAQYSISQVRTNILIYIKNCPVVVWYIFNFFPVFWKVFLRTIYMDHHLTECLGCGPEHKASWQQQANLSSPLEGGLSRNKATRKLQQSSLYLFIFSQGDSVIYKLNEWQSGQCQQPGAQWRLDCIYLWAQKPIHYKRVIIVLNRLIHAER